MTKWRVTFLNSLQTTDSQFSCWCPVIISFAFFELAKLVLLSMQNLANAFCCIISFRDQLPFPFTFSPPLFFCFSCLIFFLLLQTSFWWENVLGKLLGSQDQMKGKLRQAKVGSEKRFSWKVSNGSMLHGFSLFSPVSLTKSCSFWYGLKDLFTPHKLVDKLSCPRSLKRMMSLVIEKMWTCTGGYKQFRGEQVKDFILKFYYITH